jgi:flagellar FliL protein
MADEDAQQAQAEPRGGLPLPLIIGVGAVILLALVYFFFLRSKPAEDEEEAKVEKHEEEAEAIYEGIEQLIINPKGAQFGKYFTIKVDLLVSKEELLEVFKEKPLYKTQITDALIELLSDKTVEELEGPMAKEDLKKEILKRLNALLGPALLKEKEAASQVFLDLYYVNYLIQ